MTHESSRQADRLHGWPHFDLGALAICTLGLVLGAGCRATPTRIEVLSYKDVQAPVHYAENFDKCHYCRDAHGNWLLVMEIPPVWVEPAPAGEFAGETTTAASETAGWTSQLVQIEVFWVPYPGRTHAESTQTNAAISYHLITPDRVLTYEGAGFVYFRPPKSGKPLVGKIESASLLRATDVTDDRDLFGPCRLRGSFTAVEDRRAVFNTLNELKRTRSAAVKGDSATAAVSAP